MGQSVIAVLMLVALVVGGVIVALREREAQRRAAEPDFAELLATLTTQFAELGRVMGEQLTPAFRRVAEATEDLGRALLGGGSTKWK